MHVQAAGGAYWAFVASVFFLYWAASASRRLRLAAVLLANYVFCARFGLFYALLLPVCSTLDYLAGLGLQKFRSAAVRKALVAFSIAFNLALLSASRYGGNLLPRGWEWTFPLGLSFYVFQSLSYTIDLYRRDADGTRSLLEYLSAASFFPTLVAGPITRLSELVKQLAARPSLSRVDGGRAFFLIGLGLAKKALIADWLAGNLVNRVFDTPNLYSGFEALVAVYGYSLQLYYDFSGYTDMARGVALLLGIRLPVNFDRPYFARNMTEFWRRWHITFSDWLRDYLYFSLPGGRSKVMPYMNLVITMFLGGLWHGITATFAVWGLLHGSALALTRLWMARHRGARGEVHPARRALAIVANYHFVCLTWIFFRAGSLADAWALCRRIASLTVGFENIAPAFAIAMLLAAAALFLSKDFYGRALNAFAQCPFYVHAAALAAVALAIQFLGGRGNAPFVYSRF